MVRVFPFRGLRPIPEKAVEIASLPYDVLNTQEAKEIVKIHPNSFLRVNKAECEFDDGIDPHSETVYKRAKENLQSFIENGLMIQDEEPYFYIYKLSFNNTSQTGLCCVMPVDDYEKGLIKKHEHTRPDKVKDRANHIEYLEAQVGPVFSIFRNNSDISELFKQLTKVKPNTSFTSEDGVTHDFWVIENHSMIKTIQNRFNNLDCTYIADGHHRSESAAEVLRRKKNNKGINNLPYPIYHFLQVLFPDDEVNILPYNRIVKKPEDVSLQDILNKAESNFKITLNNEGTYSPDNPHSYGVYAEGKWYQMVLLNERITEDDPVREIDAEVLQQYFIGPILKIQDPKTDERIQFVGGNTELETRVDSGEFDMAFSLYPTTVSQLLNVADAQKVMPPKSTWFEPKLRSGMVVHLLTD